MRMTWMTKRSARRQIEAIDRNLEMIEEMEKLSIMINLIFDRLISQKESGQKALLIWEGPPLIFNPTKLH